MSTTEPPILKFQAGRPDDLDGLLRDFFRAEMPQPWPEAPATEIPQPSSRNGYATLPFAPRPAAPSWKLASHLALAASVGGLLLGTLLLSGQFKGNQAPDNSSLGSPHGNRNVIIKEVLEQPLDGPTSLRFEFTDPF